LILMARHAHWAGRLQVFHDLRDNVERALTWIQQYADADGDGYIDYTSGNTGGGLVNQGWKDTGDAIVNRDGSLATPPIALVEAQAYVYMAKVEIADLFERAGEAERARTLRQDAEALRERFNRDYWMEHERFYALAIQKGGKLSTVISSNPGHALWAGIVDEDKAHHVERRLMAPDMWSGWGVRTLSCEEKRYNPNSYHLGSVWPHDNGIIAAGLRRYGYDSSARRVFRGIFEAATHFDQYRMPELFTGFPRDDFGEPVRYQVACHPQAWAAGSLPFMMTVLLGLIPDAFNGRLRVVRPLLPDFVNFLELHRVRLGAGHVSLRFEREGEHVKVEVLRAHDVEVTVEET
jgi:glycogen debranching enzyme